VGVISVTTTAKPTSLVFTPGDGAPSVRCKGPGQQWQPSYGDTRPSSCMYTYRHASNGRRGSVFHATAAVEWTVSWRTNLWDSFLGIGTNLGHVTTGIGVPVRVREIQALAN
jgi:hypothetical protein